MKELAVLSFYTESIKVRRTHHTTPVPVLTIGTVPTKSPFVPGTILDFTLRINVAKWTFFIAASIVFGEEITLGHFGQVIFVQEFTLVALFTETSQPVFAHNSFLAKNVTAGTLRSVDAALTTGIEHTNWGPRFVHSLEGKELGAQLVFESHFNIEDQVVDVGY